MAGRVDEWPPPSIDWLVKHWHYTVLNVRRGQIVLINERNAARLHRSEQDALRDLEFSLASRQYLADVILRDR